MGIPAAHPFNPNTPPLSEICVQLYYGAKSESNVWNESVICLRNWYEIRINVYIPNSVCTTPLTGMLKLDTLENQIILSEQKKLKDSKDSQQVIYARGIWSLVLRNSQFLNNVINTITESMLVLMDYKSSRVSST